MVRRVVEEEDVSTPTTVIEDDGSWVGRTIVTLVILALLVAGAIWLVRNVSNNNTNDNNNTPKNNIVPTAQVS